MEIRVSSTEEVPRKYRFVELFSPVRKPRCKVEEIDVMADIDSVGFRLMNDELFEPEDAEVDRSIIKSIFLDDKAQLVIQANQLSQKTSKCEESTEDELDEERAECRGIVSRLLRLCCLFDSVKCAAALLNGELMGAMPLVNEMDDTGLSPLHTAATAHAVKCIELLLSKKARTDIKSKDGRSQVPLELSLSNRRMDVVWKVGDPIEDLLVCLNQKNMAAVRLLAEKTKEIGEVAYSIAINGQAVSLASLLMVASEKVLLPVAGVGNSGDLGSKENITIYDCIMNEALALGKEEYSCLLTWSTHPSKTFRCTSDTVSSAESVSMRRKLLLCEMELCQLFGAGPLMNLGEKKAVSPLVYAIQAADLEVVQLLLETGVNLSDSETDAQGNSALHWALKMNSALCLTQMKIVGLLLKHGARVTQKNKLGLTALHIAASNGNFQAVQILLSEEPNSVHTVTEMKETPLFLAVKNDHKECVELLLRSGANSEVLNIRKQRPIDFAKSQDMRFTLNPTNIRLSHHASQTQQKLSLDGKGVLGGVCSTLSTIGKDSSITESLRKLEPCKYFKSSHGCARGSKCFYAHDEEHGPPKGRHPSCIQSSELKRKIFVGGLPASVDSDSLGKYFEHFGSVEDALVVQQQSCDQRHACCFGFVTFKHEKSVTVAVQAHYILIMGKQVEIKRFFPGGSSFEPVKVLPPQEIEQKCIDHRSQTPCTEVKKAVEDNPQKISWVDKLFQNEHEVCPLDLQAQASHSTVKGKEPEWLGVFRKWFPSFMKKKFKSLGQDEFYALSSLKADFRATCGFELNHSSLGYSKLSQFLVSFTDICHVKYVPEKGKGSATHMVLVPNRTVPTRRPSEPVKSTGASSHSESSGSNTDDHLDYSKIIQDAVSPPVHLRGCEVSNDCDCVLFQDFLTKSSSLLDHKSYDPPDDFPVQSCTSSYTTQSGDSNGFDLIQAMETQLGALSSEDEISDLSIDFLFRDLWLNEDRTSSPICLGATSGLNPALKADNMKSSEDNTFLNTRFLQFLSPDPLFHTRPWINNESCRGTKSAKSESHPVLEDLARRNSLSIFFLREFDFYLKYYRCLAEEKCFSCSNQRMSWANYPCRHLLWCDDCRDHAVEAARRSEHKCVICDASVKKLVHNFNPTSWSKVIQPHCLSIKDYKEFPSLDAPILGSPCSLNISAGCQLGASTEISNEPLLTTDMKIKNVGTEFRARHKIEHDTDNTPLLA
ncbi:unnamed protein product [Rhodiola kirilowii]